MADVTDTTVVPR